MGRMYDVIKMALPKNGLSGAEKNADTSACTINIPQSRSFFEVKESTFPLESENCIATVCNVYRFY